MNHNNIALVIYQDENGREPFNEWLYSIKDVRALARIDNRLERITGVINEIMNQTKRQFRKYEDSLKERLTDPEYARIFLDVALEEYEKDGDTKAFLLALRDVVAAQGGIAKIAEQTKLNRQNLYKALSEEGNPRLRTLGAVLHGLGFRLSVESIKNELAK